MMKSKRGRVSGSAKMNAMMNPEGLTWIEWVRAAGVTESDMASFDRIKERDLLALRAGWEAGEDPSDYRAGMARRNRQGRASGEQERISRSAVGAGVYRRIEVKLRKVAPNHFQITAKQWIAGTKIPGAHLGGSDFRGTGSAAIKEARRIGAQLEAEFPDHLVEVVTTGHAAGVAETVLELDPGYAYKLSRGRWDTEVVSDDDSRRSVVAGFANIDGQRMRVFKVGRTTYAQTFGRVRAR